MYVIFRDEMIDSEDIIEKINKSTNFKVITDLTKATKREDVMSFKMAIPVEKLDENTIFDWENEELVNELFSKTESLTRDILDFFPKYTVEASSAYKWEELDNSIYIVIVIANIDIKLKKLKLDILPRMMKQVD
ncbi:MAG: hypothetical protein PEPC_01386 [Peptostreptococcus russellii]|uniref:Uncharacterized protein n=1 Tax=Peptostreptococcus russellii TaxID=215200 RepID=A0A2P7PZ70_9FIRM|nr:hypothetical protein [Peptostreptococcus russellii]PSJ30995.1 hypothetical protein UF10_06635 [Peptostreptococcus russellii]